MSKLNRKSTFTRNLSQGDQKKTKKPDDQCLCETDKTCRVWPHSTSVFMT